MSALLLAAVALPALAGAAAAVAGSGRAVLAGRATAAATGLAFVVALAVAVQVAASGRVSAVLEPSEGAAPAGLTADRVGAILLLLVLGVSAVVQAFAVRYLRGDVRAARFAAGAGLLTAATAATVTAATLVGLAVAWSLAGLALLGLLGLYRGHPAADEGVRRTRLAFAVGDGALWLAVALAVATWGDLDLRALGEEAPALARDTAALTAVACLLVVAALARCAQLPLQGWLPATLAAPTPVSALLHAGVVNAGGVLLVRLGPVFGASAAATHLAFAAGAATAAYGTALMLARPDVKGRLAHSTTAQMGFMLVACALGAFTAAVLHLVAHAMYKAALFLGSGGAVGRHVRRRKAPPRAALARAARLRIAATAVLAPAATLGAAAWLLGPLGTEVLLLPAWLTAAWAAWGWLRRRPTAAWVLAAAAGLVVASGAYVLLLRAGGAFLAPAVEQAGDATVAAWALAPLVALLALAALLPAAPPRLAGALYVWALGAGRVVPRPAARARAVRLGGWALPRPLVARSQGGRA